MEAQETAGPIALRREADAPAYEAPNHWLVRSVRLQGLEAGGAEAFWVGLSRIEPGGGAGPDSSALEKVYVILDGAITVTSGTQQIVLQKHDSCTIPPGTERLMENAGSEPAVMLVVMPRP